MKILTHKLSEARVKSVIFVGSQIRKIVDSDEFALVNAHEKLAWNSLKAVVHGYLGHNSDKNYEEFIEIMSKFEWAAGCLLKCVYYMLTWTNQ